MQEDVIPPLGHRYGFLAPAPVIKALTSRVNSWNLLATHASQHPTINQYSIDEK